MASVLGLVFGGLRIADAVGTASAYSRSVRLADVGEQVTALAQAMEDERDLTIGVVALTMLQQNAPAGNAGSPVAASLTADLKQEKRSWPAPRPSPTPPPRSAQSASRGHRVRLPGEHPGQGRDRAHPDQVPARSGRPQPRLRKSSASCVATDSPIQVIDSYSGVLSILFALDDEITSGSGDVQLGDDVRALSALSAAEDQASQQRAILYGALVASALSNAAGSNGSQLQQRRRPDGARRLRRAGRVHHRAGPPVRRPAVVRRGGHPGPDHGRHRAQASQDSAAAQLIENLVSTAGDPSVIFPLATANLMLGFTDTATSPGGLVHRHVRDHRRDADDQRPARRRGRGPQPAASAPGVRVGAC